MASDETSRGDTTIPLVEETATLAIRERVTGRTRVSTRTETVAEDVAATLESQHVEVTRVPVGRDLDPEEPVPLPREEAGTTIVPVLEEVLVVEKRLRLVEEVRIRRVTEVEDVHVPVALRRQVVDIERDDVPAEELKAANQPANHEEQTDGL